jgi:hypothetical protein
VQIGEILIAEHDRRIRRHLTARIAHVPDESAPADRVRPNSRPVHDALALVGVAGITADALVELPAAVGTAGRRTDAFLRAHESVERIEHAIR